MERHREILLESYLVHRADVNGDGVLDLEERQVLLSQIQSALQQKFLRQTLHQQIHAMNITNIPLPKVSKPLWSSTDGYPFVLKTPSDSPLEEDIKAPNESMYNVDDPPHTRAPKYDFVEICLTANFVKSTPSTFEVDTETLFQLFSKEYPYCGDMLLAILIPSSPIGLHHLLPPRSHPKYRFLTHQLYKYSYTISYTSSEFIMATSVEALNKGFQRILRTLKNKSLAQFCVNDDIILGDTRVTELLFQGIIQGYFGGFTSDGGRSPVEKIESVGKVSEVGAQFWRSVSLYGGPGYDGNNSDVVL